MTTQDYLTLDRIEQTLTTVDHITVDDARWMLELILRLVAPPSSPVADSPTDEQDERREIFIAAIRTMREHCRVEAACTAGHANYRERQYTFMLKLDEALQIIDASAPSAAAAAPPPTWFCQQCSETFTDTRLAAAHSRHTYHVITSNPFAGAPNDDPPYCDPEWLPESRVDCFRAGWTAARTDIHRHTQGGPADARSKDA